MENTEIETAENTERIDAKSLRCRTVIYQMLDLKIVKLQAKRARNKGLNERDRKTLEELLKAREKESLAESDESKGLDFSRLCGFLGAKGLEKGLLKLCFGIMLFALCGMVFKYIILGCLLR